MSNKAYVPKPQVWKIMRCSDGEPAEVIIQPGLFWCLKDYPLSRETEPETGFDKRPAVG